MKFLLLTIPLFLSSCAYVASSLTPIEVVNSVAKATAVAKVMSNKNEPKTLEEIQKYLEINFQYWAEVSRFYGVEVK